jgi:hypothetical protein
MSLIERDDDLCPHGWPPEFCGNCHEEEADDARLCVHHRCEICGPARNSQLRGAVEEAEALRQAVADALAVITPDSAAYPVLKAAYDSPRGGRQ